jgi:hypothetical protein
MYPCTSSGLVASSSAIIARPALFHGITLLQASAACTAIVYDNASTNSGTAVEQVNNNTNTSTVSVKLNHPVECRNGIYVALTGTGANVIIHYSPL